MFNCYSGSGMAAAAFSLQQPKQLCLRLYFPPPPRDSSLSIRFSLSLSLSLTLRDLFHYSTRSPSPFSAATLARLLLSLSAAVSINLPSLTLFTACVHPARATVFPAETSFRSLWGRGTHPSFYVFISRSAGKNPSCAKNSPCIADTPSSIIGFGQG